MTTALTIASTSVRQDEHGRFCLNDLHKASGGADRNKPGNWLMLTYTKELEAEIAIAGIPAINTQRGRYGGTYAVKELVYAYAMWVSPKFHLAVIRAYDQMVTSGRVQPTRQPAEMSRMEILQLALDSEQKRIEADAKLAIAAPKAEALDRFADVRDSKSITDAAKALKVGPRKLAEFLQGIGWIYRRGVAGALLANQALINSGHMFHAATSLHRPGRLSVVVNQPRLTPKGIAKVAQLLGTAPPSGSRSLHASQDNRDSGYRRRNRSWPIRSQRIDLPLRHVGPHKFLKATIRDPSIVDIQTLRTGNAPAIARLAGGGSPSINNPPLTPHY